MVEHWQAVCMIPCQVDVPAATLTLGLSTGGVPRRALIANTQRWNEFWLHQDSRADERLFGGLVIASGVVFAGLALLVGKLETGGPILSGGMDLGWGIVAMVSGAVGLGLGLPFAALFDHTSLEVEDPRDR
ncbi:MAG: hypothetical protein AB8I08_28640 [Sandaracinaceae bacterium]